MWMIHKVNVPDVLRACHVRVKYVRPIVEPDVTSTSSRRCLNNSKGNGNKYSI